METYTPKSLWMTLYIPNPNTVPASQHISILMNSWKLLDLSAVLLTLDTPAVIFHSWGYKVQSWFRVSMNVLETWTWNGRGSWALDVEKFGKISWWKYKQTLNSVVSPLWWWCDTWIKYSMFIAEFISGTLIYRIQKVHCLNKAIIILQNLRKTRTCAEFIVSEV